MSLLEKKILVVGAGISGMTVAIEAAEVGYRVALIEKKPYIGGRIARMNQFFPKLCSTYCGLEINLKRIKANRKLEIYTMTELAGVSGSPGNYTVTLSRKPRLVNSNCVSCGACVNVCPVERKKKHFDYSIGKNKAIYLPHELSYPSCFTIDSSVCKGAECAKCVAVCKYNAINMDERPENFDLSAAAIVIATGWKPYDATRMENLGFEKFRNVINNWMMERLASVSGPTGGRILRPSDGKEAKNVVFVQCAGSRDDNHLPYCSSVCCMVSLKQATYVRRRYADSQVHIFYTDIRARGVMESFYNKVSADENVKLLKGKVTGITENPATENLTVFAEDASTGYKIEIEADLVVLATGMRPAALDPKILGAARFDQYGFLAPDPDEEGILAAGCSKRPMDVASSVQDATGTALKAIQGIVRGRGD